MQSSGILPKGGSFLWWLALLEEFQFLDIFWIYLV